jgi:spermidine/putrescine transport system permease protein
VWLFTKTATNYSPLLPSVAVIGTLVSAALVVSLALTMFVVRRVQGRF